MRLLTALVLFILVIHPSSLEKSKEHKKFPVPRHILTDNEPIVNTNFSSPQETLVNETLNNPLIAFAEQANGDESRTSESQFETTTLPESFALQSNQNLCSRPAKCEPLPPNATWY